MVKYSPSTALSCGSVVPADTVAVAALPKIGIIDVEVTAFDPLGLLDFHALHSRTADDDT